VAREIYFEEIIAKGHRLVRATHGTTFEITRESFLTPRGDCIVAISANKALKDLGSGVRRGIRSAWPVAVVINSSSYWDSAVGYGDHRLDLSDPVRIVIRKSSYISPNTLMIRSTKAAADLDRRLVEDIRREGDVYIYIVTSSDRAFIEDIARRPSSILPML